jgi:hypothetical protein
MRHLITDILTFIHQREQCVSLKVEGREEPIRGQFTILKKLAGQISVLELEILLNSFCEPGNYYQKGETMPNGTKAFDETMFPKTWKITLAGTLDELRIKNQSHLLRFQHIYDIHVFEKITKQLAVRVRTIENNIYFYPLAVFEKLVGVKQNEFSLLRGAFISPVMYKKGDYSDFFGRFTPIKEDDKIVKTFNFRVDGTIDNNFNLHGNQKLVNEYKYSDNQRYPGDDDDDERHRPRYEKYNGYNGFDDFTIDTAFEGDPDATWNVD